MADFIKVAAAGAKQSLSKQSIEIRHSVLIEVVAALLGYHTFAALNAEELDQSLDRRCTNLIRWSISAKLVRH